MRLTPRALNVPLAMQQPRHEISPEEYFALDEASEERLEYWHGAVVAMAGETPHHSTIKDNVVAALREQRSDCYVRSSGPRVRAPGFGRENYAYPDGLMTCGDEQYDEQTQPPTLLNPMLVVEILAASTGHRDLADKFEAYFCLESLREYWIIDAERPHVRRCTRTEGGILVQMLQSLDETLASDVLGAAIPLRTIYRRALS